MAELASINEKKISVKIILVIDVSSFSLVEL